ncbi:MAG: hypothetical protein ACYC3I_03255 [Gemmataceae bacterium]
MPFANYAAMGDVARAYRIALGDEKFVTLLERPISNILREELAFAENHANFRNSEAAVCENLIYPILKEVWKSYLQDLMLWSHEQLHYDADLSGIPDYFVSRRSSLGRWGVEPPYVIVIEAKRDDFERGWGQCLAALLAAQKLNNLPELTFYGIATNGRSWEFGKLEGATFNHDSLPFSSRNVEELCAALHFVFAQCQTQVARLPRSA